MPAVADLIPAGPVPERESHRKNAQQIKDQRPLPGMNTTWKSHSNKPANARATVLVPARLEEDLLVLFDRFGGMRGLLGHLLRRHGVVAREINRAQRPRIATRYQPENQDLQKRHFRAVGHGWAWVRALARSSGVSICYFVVVMIELELGEPTDIKNDGTPPLPARIQHREWVNLRAARLGRIGIVHNNPKKRPKGARRRRRRG